ncbi:hypothetical protein C7974DRAFT_107974 [Boeremia exigua]|uniref:uncharacterized protein n=1 Tax=Boeremia exigua TaxID=749465 RepID=UPI001E8DC68C|nr:uncharacterized protein C7974DRAFT_107974 [Boeremia exigua]KAH6642751.1 hypothetical protein C7974DRAFT_107974 [Boeremia exigua]
MPHVTELVEMQLTRPFEAFLPFFEREQLPTLLAAPGLVSVRTGPKLNDPNSAISITLWTSLAAHSAFLSSPAAAAFFQRMETWLSGPPAVLHYEVGDLAGVDGRGYVRVSKGTAKNVEKLGKELSKTGVCLEDGSQGLCLDFSQTQDGIGERDGEERDGGFVVHVQSYGRAGARSVL